MAVQASGLATTVYVEQQGDSHTSLNPLNPFVSMQTRGSSSSRFCSRLASLQARNDSDPTVLKWWQPRPALEESVLGDAGFRGIPSKQERQQEF